MARSGVTLTGNWQAATTALEGMAARLRAAVRAAHEQLARELEEAVREGLQSQAPAGQPFVPLHAFTAEQKGSSTALAGGPLEAAVKATVSSDGLKVRVGIPASARAPDGTSLAMVARVQEHGATIDVTPKMRAFLAARGLHLRASTVTLVIPARPFLRPILRAMRPRLRVIYGVQVARVLLPKGVSAALFSTNH